jgi:hypothetical protein
VRHEAASDFTAVAKLGGVRMIGSLLVSSALVVLQVPGQPPEQKEQPAAAPKAAVEINPGAATAEYNALKDKTPSTAAAQWKLGVWCEEHGLKDLAYVHFSEVARLDPRRDAVWRKLGFKKHNGHWTTDEQIAEQNEQKKADKIWGPKLRKLHKDIHGTNGAKKRDIASAEVDEISDPRALVCVYREFGGGGQLDQMILIQVLGQIDKPISSEILALLSVYGKTPQVRQTATQTLRGRRADDFLHILVSLMVDPLKYEVKSVGGPGSPGVLFVEGAKFNVSRFYAPPAPNFTPQPGDVVMYDASGTPLISRPISQSTNTVTHGVPGSKTLVKSTTTTDTQTIQLSPYEMFLEAQRAAMMAEAQLQQDVAIVKSINDDRKQFNALVMAVAKDTTGKDCGLSPKEWRDALAAGNGSPKRASDSPFKPTFPELVPLAYNPVFTLMPVGFTRQSVTSTRVYADS